jgi:hypothetical protein
MSSSRQSSHDDEVEAAILYKLEKLSKKTPQQISDLIENFERNLRYLNQQNLSLTRTQFAALDSMYDVLLEFKKD